MNIQRPTSKRLFRAATFLLAALFCAVSLTAGAADLSADFDSANRLYEQGKFADAAAAYERLIETGPVSPALYFNLGNARFKAGDIGRAIGAYRRAEQLAPRDPEIRANLQFARSQVSGPTMGTDRTGRWLGKLTVNEWATLAAVAFWLWLSVLTLGQVRPAWRPGLRNLAWLFGVATIGLTACLSAVWSKQSAPIAIALGRDTVVHNGPLEESPAAFTVQGGAELAVLDRKDDWLQVGIGERRPGWVKREQVYYGSKDTDAKKTSLD